jgi:hypothetical protein
VDVQGISPDAVESSLSQLETQFDQILSRIIEQRILPVGEDLILLMNFVALMAVRNPRMRESWRQFQESIANHVMNIALSSEQMWQHQMQRMRDDGISVPDISYERMKLFNEGGEYDIVVPTESHIQMEIDVLSSIIPLLLERKWMLFVAPTDSGGFITSDHPVALFWNDGLEHRSPPGHKMLNTEVVFPISKELLMAGTFDGEQEIVFAKDEDVARANAIVLSYAGRQVYGSTNYVHYLRPGDGKMCRGSALLTDYSRNERRAV